MRIFLSLFLAAQVVNATFPSYEVRGCCEEAGEPLARICPPEYNGDGETMMPGPNAREISRLMSTGNSRPSRRFLSDMIWSWGQFIDHDIDLTEEHTATEGIEIPEGDPFFPASCTHLPFKRSDHILGSGNIRQQVNSITPLLDGSNVYGSDENRMDWLRQKTDGLMKTSGNGRLLPKNTAGFDNAGGNDPNFFLAGDIRVNEQMGLTSMHTLFVREHNRLAVLIKAKHYPEMASTDCSEGNPSPEGKECDDNIYELTRRIVGALIQCITYEEFLPAILGRFAPDVRGDNGYDPSEDPQITNEFSTFAFRFGHSMVSNDLMEGLGLMDAFFQPDKINEEMVDLILNSFPHQMSQDIDCEVVPALQQNLFGEVAEGSTSCFDLLAFNIERGRDHGLPTLNGIRAGIDGMEPHATFRSLTSDSDLARRLEEAYGTVDAVDAWVGGLAEDPNGTSGMGEVVTYIIRDQFRRMMKADRHFYKRDPMMSGSEMEGIMRHGDWRLASVIARNTQGDMDPSRAVMYSHGLAGGWGDPHFKDWSGEDFDFHGECDLVLGNAPSFGNGQGLNVHVRTKHQVAYSYIEAAAVKIGDDTFELGSYGEWFLNGVEGADIEEDTNLAGYRLTVDEKSTKKKQIFNLHLTKDSKIVMSAYKQLVRVDWDISGADFEQFSDISGLMGSWQSGTHFARDGQTVLEDVNEYGLEWQVRPDKDAILFENKRWPQYPSRCFMPQVDEEMKRRLGASEISQETARAACKHVERKSTRDACVNDVIALQDLSIADEIY